MNFSRYYREAFDPNFLLSDTLRIDEKGEGADMKERYKDYLFKKGYRNPTGFRRWVKVAKHKK